MRKKFKFLTVCIIFIIILGFGKAYNVYGYTKKTNVLEDNSQTSYAKDKTPSADNTLKIYDYAKLIPDDKEKEIYNMIKKFISKYNMDMAIVTINKNGLLLLIDMDNRKMWISTTGKAIEIYNDKRIDAILDYTYDKISKKDYSGCAEQFIKYATYFAKKGRNGGDTIISTSKMIKSSLICSSIATAIFIIIGVCSHRKPQKNREASKYISKPLKLTEQTDQFLDKHVSQTRRVESSSSSGESSGSSTHSGSSGTSHGGGGGSF